MKPRLLLSLVLLTLAALAAAAWVGGWGPWALSGASLAVVLALAWLPRGRRRVLAGGGVLVLVISAAFLAEWDLHRFSSQWPDTLDRWEQDVQETLAEELDGLLQVGERVVERLAGSWDELAPAPGSPVLSGLVEPGVDAVAVFGPAGDLRAWEGTHQGPFPEQARRGVERYLYIEGALFGYLYVAQPLPDDEGIAVSASLLRADLPPGLAEGLTDFSSRFLRSEGARIRISRPDRVEGESVWDLRWEDRVLLSVTVDPLSEGDALERRAVQWQRFVTLGILLAWLLLLLGSGRQVPDRTLLSLGLLGVLFLVPLGRLLGMPELFSPTGLLLPVRPSVTLGDLLVVGSAAVLVSGIFASPRLARIPSPAAAIGGALGAVAILMLLAAGTSRELLAEGTWGWVGFQGAGVLLVGLVFVLTLLTGKTSASRIGRGSLLVGLVLALLLTGLAVARVRTGPDLTLWAALLWAVPLWFVIRALPWEPEWGMGALRVVLGLTLAASLVLPWAWSMRVEAQKLAAEERIERLGTRADSFLEFLLLRAGEEAVALAGTGRNAVEILYGAWVRSGLAEEDVPLWLTVWSPDGRPQEELRIGVAEERPAMPLDLLERAILDGQVGLRRFDLADMHYVAVAPLARSAAISITVPPRRSIAGPAPLGPLFSPARARPDPLVLIPLMPGELPGTTDGVEWIRTPEGWQGELHLVYPDEVYHAHYTLELPGFLLLVARGTLLFLLFAVPTLLLWTLGARLGRGSREPGSPGLQLWINSFRGKVTIALFIFFLIPSLGFGTMAYRTLAGAAVRTAETLAERAVEEAAGWYDELGGAMDVLARRTGSDLLLYARGELVAGSLEELVDLGLYQGWLPAPIYGQMAAGEDLIAATTATLGGWEYVIAYRRIQGGQVLAAPAPLQAGATALRQREIADLLGFTLVLGAGLSVLLSLLVGRALTRPIQTLQVASERVGAGNMGVHLPEDRTDEFGAVFSAFNRMVDRLSHTRRALIRSSRRTRAIVEEVATGVVALDPAGRVILANPRAEELLGVPLEMNEPLPAGEEGDAAQALSHWVQIYLRDGLREASTDLQVGSRRLRVRARRVSRRGPPGGVVVSLEDVTDELRTERILAWGEMARQVAHEVKNPLTPIKLGIQHIRRAWEDERSDFGPILDRNVEAILTEIDRLSAIASGFSRYGAPSPPGSGEVKPVEVGRVVEEILTLYQAGDGPIRFRANGLDGLPEARARSGELKEVLVNLLENARAALPGKGTVTIQGQQGDGELLISVRDDGAGIPGEVLHRIFDPYFSTQSGGSGLGLAIVRRLVEGWGGRTWAESEEGGGAVVTFTVPLWDENPAA